MKIATGEISWEQAAIQASDNSWKDEAWTVAFIAIIVCSVCTSASALYEGGLR